MLGLIKEKLFGGQSSKHRAKSRLHFVLVQDRTGLTAEDMAKFREEMIAVIDKYFVIDKQAFDVSYKRDSQSTTLLINSPVVVKRQEAIGGVAGKREKKEDKKDKAIKPVQANA